MMECSHDKTFLSQKEEDLPDYVCLGCNKRGGVKEQLKIDCYP